MGLFRKDQSDKSDRSDDDLLHESLKGCEREDGREIFDVTRIQVSLVCPKDELFLLSECDEIQSE